MNVGCLRNIRAVGPGKSYRSVRPSLFFEALLESLQLVSVNVGNCPVVEVGVSPMQKVITLARNRLCSFGRVRLCRPNKQVNKMFSSLINQRRHRPVIEVIEATANQWETLAGKVGHGRRKIEFRI